MNYWNPDAEYCEDCGTELPPVPNYVIDGFSLCISCWRERKNNEEI